MTGKIIKFPTMFEGKRLDTSKVRITALEKRLALIEQRLANYSDDMAYLIACSEEDEYELSEILNELTNIHGFVEDYND